MSYDKIMSFLFFVLVLVLVIISDFYKRKYKFRGRRNPFILGFMPYVFIFIMFSGSIVSKDYRMLLMSTLGLIVTVIATSYAVQKIKKEYYPIDSSTKVGLWIMFPFFAFLGYMLVALLFLSV